MLRFRIDCVDMLQGGVYNQYRAERVAFRADDGIEVEVFNENSSQIENATLYLRDWYHQFPVMPECIDVNKVFFALEKIDYLLICSQSSKITRSARGGTSSNTYPPK